MALEKLRETYNENVTMVKCSGMVCVDEYAMVDCELTFISLNGSYRSGGATLWGGITKETNE
jgi:hypothetical protein